MVTVSLLIGFMLGQGSGEREAAQQEEPADRRVPTTEEGNRAPATEEELTFSGKGDGATRPFQLEQGLRVFEVEHGEAEEFTLFSVRLLPEEENAPEVTVPGLQPGIIFSELLSEGETFEGSKAVRVSKSGTYVLQIEADAPWTVSIR